LIVETVLAQYTADLSFPKPLLFQFCIGGDPYGDPIKIYRGYKDFIREVHGSKGTFPAMDSLSKEAHKMEWLYLTVRPLVQSQGHSLQIKIEDDIPINGTYCDATFICTSEVE